MSRELTLFGRFLKVVTPTRVQLLAISFLALFVLVAFESGSILHRIGVSDLALTQSQTQAASRFSVISHSTLASNIALVGFWSIVGLVAYLICWAAYNLLVEFRNEVTLETQYKNLGGRRGHMLAVVIKLVSITCLIIAVASFKDMFAWALALAQPVIWDSTVANIIGACAGVALLAAAMYLVLVLVELSFSAWYRPEAFTD